jgi:hypothetical protein
MVVIKFIIIIIIIFSGFAAQRGLWPPVTGYGLLVREVS